MHKQYVLTLIGDDKPGLVDSLARQVKEHGGNWLESRMANLAGKFSGIVLVTVDSEQCEEFESAIAMLKSSGLSVRATSVDSPTPTGRHTSQLSLVANDRPGILSELTSTLAGLKVNVEELITDCAPASMSSELLFRAKVTVSIPDSLDDNVLVTALENLSNDLMVEVD